MPGDKIPGAQDKIDLFLPLLSCLDACGQGRIDVLEDLLAKAEEFLRTAEVEEPSSVPTAEVVCVGRSDIYAQCSRCAASSGCVPAAQSGEEKAMQMCELVCPDVLMLEISGDLCIL